MLRAKTELACDDGEDNEAVTAEFGAGAWSSWLGGPTSSRRAGQRHCRRQRSRRSAAPPPAVTVTASQAAKTAIPIATPIDAAFFSANCAVTEAAFRGAAPTRTLPAARIVTRRALTLVAGLAGPP
jgi:hypothetical protein